MPCLALFASISACVLLGRSSRSLKACSNPGSLNQRAVLEHRSALVEALYASTEPSILMC